MDGQGRGRALSCLWHAGAAAPGLACHIATVSVASVLLVWLGCAGSEAPWDVGALEQGRFEETTRICRLLTDDGAGELVPERFEKCMKRRGWKRQGFLKRLFSGD
jgi:hypothetical protein